jgi:hypothetical protein
MSPGKSCFQIVRKTYPHPQVAVTNLRLIARELSMAVCQSFQTDGELDITTAHNILDLEFGELGIETKLLYDSRVLA